MKTPDNSNDDGRSDRPQRQAESKRLLSDVLDVTRGTDQTSLHNLASVVYQILQWNELEDESADSDEIDAFLTVCMDEIRTAIESDGSPTDQLDQRRCEAIDRWGDELTSLDHGDIDGDSSSVELDYFESDLFDDEPESETSDDPDLAIPSAEEISLLMSRLAGDVSDQNLPSQPSTETDLTASNDQSLDQARPGSAASAIHSLVDDLREAFLDDASGCVGTMEKALLELEANANDTASLNQICRELHTLKGASASVGLTELADHIHSLEDRIRDDQTAGKEPAVDLLFNAIDSIRVQIFGATDSVPPVQVSPDPAASIQAPSADPSVKDVPVPTPRAMPVSINEDRQDDETIRIKSSQLNRLMDMLAELVMLRNRRETEVGQLQEIYHELIGTASKMRLLSSEGQIQSSASKSIQLTEVANDAMEIATHIRDCARPVADGNAAVTHFIRQFRQELVELRRTPISGLFPRLQRVARDAASTESKRVRLKLLGADAGIERSLQQRLYEPLLHIVRNSVCHGIEDPDERTRCGKPPVGTITLEAKSNPNLFVIEVRDDGQGLDYDSIRRRGIASGLLDPDHPATREELSQLIFQPGFSTRESADQIAGRGVGMDVVASTLQRMRGWLEVHSDPGQGTQIRLSFPLPSVIQHVMVFRSGVQLFALPMQSVRHAGELTEDQSCISFADVLDHPPNLRDMPQQAIVLACDSTSSGSVDSEEITLVVDEIIGPEEVVVRPLPDLLKSHPFCCGATLSGMGQTVLLLDARRFVDLHIDRLRSTSELRHPTPAASTTDRLSMTENGRPRVLVVDDSRSARKRVVRCLQRYPVEIIEACDGREALRILKSECFAAVFSDMEMPHISGMELLAEVNSFAGSHPPPVVIISSRGEPEFTGRARELGANNYLIKPLTDKSLDEALADIPTLNHLALTLPNALQLSGDMQ